MADKITRIAIVDSNRCKPKRCAQECKKSCPVVRMGKLCIEVKSSDKIAFISEFLCIGCGICVKKCPFEAITIINLPTNLESQVTHRYTANAFKLHRLPTPRPGQVLGLVGTNGIGKSTALKILAGKLKPNLGRYDDPFKARNRTRDRLCFAFGGEFVRKISPVVHPNSSSLALWMSSAATVHFWRVGQRHLGFKHLASDAKSRPVAILLLVRMDVDLDGVAYPNLQDPPDWQEILKYFRGSELQNYFTKVLEDNLKALIKPQYVDHIPRAIKGKMSVTQMLDSKLELDNKQLMCDELELNKVLDREVSQLSGGELQRFAIAMSCIQKADVYMFDEPSSYLDIKQRLKAAEVIRSLLTPDCYVVAVEHDLSVLDYLSDFICCLYGKPSMYGVVTMPSSVREGINIFLDGFIPTENLRFREESLSFKMVETAEEVIVEKTAQYSYPAMTKTLGGFKLSVEAGSFTDSEIIVMLGENGTGKTTFIRLLAGDTPDIETDKQTLSVSLKPQTISPKFPGTVRMLLLKRIKQAFMHPQFQTDVLKPMNLENIMDQEVKTLSGGELQRVAIVLALGVPNVSLYLLDEPSSFLDSEQRIIASKVIKRFVLHAKKTAFVIEHDFIMATYLADRVIVFEGQPAVSATATPPQTLLSGMNRFLASLEITFRRDPTNYRPRVNKLHSVKDREQKASGNYFFLED